MRSVHSGNEFVFLPLGGCGEIGMNFNAYGFGPPDQRCWIVVDCGVLFGRETTMPGIDLVLPDIRFLTEQRENVLGMVFTHAHEDHIGAVSHLWPLLRCPLYATAFTARLIEHKLLEAKLAGTVRVNILPLNGTLTLGPFDLELLSITHSIPEPNALAIRTPLGAVLHTGDWKLDPEPLISAAPDASAFQALGDEGVLALVCDSTNALVNGNSGSEAQVQRSLSELIRTLKGRVAVTSFASNVARLNSVAKAAKETGRHLVLVGRAMHRITSAARETGYLMDFPNVLDEADAAHLPPDRVLYLCTGSQGEPMAALSRIASASHPNVSLSRGDTVIFSSRVIPGNELAIFEVQNRLAALEVEVITDHDHFVHVSGHPCRDELAQMYRWSRPRISVPVHGERRHQQAHAALALSLQVPQAAILENGQMLRLAPGKAQIIDEVPSGRVYLDGRAPADVETCAMRNRRALAFAGFLGITLALDEKSRLAGEPAYFFEGIPDSVQSPVRVAVDETLRRFKPRKSETDGLAEKVRLAARRAANDVWGKKPITRVELVWI